MRIMGSILYIEWISISQELIVIENQTELIVFKLQLTNDKSTIRTWTKEN